MERNELLILDLFYRHKVLSAKEIHASLNHLGEEENETPFRSSAWEKGWLRALIDVWAKNDGFADHTQFKISPPTVYKALKRLEKRGALVHPSGRSVWYEREWWNFVNAILDSRTVFSYSRDPFFGEGEGIHHYYSQKARPLITPNLDIDFRPYDPLISYYLIDAPEKSDRILRDPETNVVFEKASYLLYLNAISRFYSSEYNRDERGRRLLSREGFSKILGFGSIKNGLPGDPSWPEKFSEWMKAENVSGRTFLILEVNNQRMLELLKSARHASQR